MPQPADMLSLGFLSEYEQQLIMGVLQRDEELRRIEEKRVRSEASAGTMMIMIEKKIIIKKPVSVFWGFVR